MEQSRVIALDIENLGKDAGNKAEIEAKFPILKKDIHQVISELRKHFDF